MVMAHARGLLHGTPDGRIAYVHADLRQPERILGDADTRDTLSFREPVALMLLAVLHFLTDDHDSYRVVNALIDALPAGSYVVISHPTPDFDPARVAKSVQVGKDAGVPVRLRTLAEFQRFLSGLDMLAPGAVTVSEWRPDHQDNRPGPHQVNCYGAVARKP
jgi:S-adenosyl methyltransferase